MSLDDPFDQVAEFHRRFGHPVAERPRLLKSPRADGRVAWMREEIDEFVAAADVVDQADAMIDLIYFALGTRSAHMLEELKSWMAANNTAIMAVVMLVIGLMGPRTSGLELEKISH